MKDARDRKSAELGHRVEGRKGYQGNFPAVYEALRTIVTNNPTMTLERICVALENEGHMANGKTGEATRYKTAAVNAMMKTIGLHKVDGRSLRYANKVA